MISASGGPHSVPANGDSPDGSMETGAAGLVAIKGSAEYKRAQALLKEALERSLRIEQARELAEKMASNVQVMIYDRPLSGFSCSAHTPFLCF